MSIMGIGVDIEDIARFRKLPYAKNKSFYGKVFTKKEIAYCLKKPDPYPSFAARFAAKEAVIKALPSLPAGGVKNFHAVEVVMKKNKPLVLLRGHETHISLSHDNEKALAFVVLLGR